LVITRGETEPCVATWRAISEEAGGERSRPGIGGGVALENNSTATITNTSFLGNLAQGGAGGSGANGGAGIGGAIAVAIGGASDSSSVSLSHSSLIGNVAQGGKGGAGANGGNGSGGGAFIGAAGSASFVVSKNPLPERS